MLHKWLLRRALRIAYDRAPDFVIGGDDDPYLERWWIIPRNRFFNIYLHKFSRSDDDRALHDHPWFSVSILLWGEYIEHTKRPDGTDLRKVYYAGDVKFRTARAAHRIELIDGWPCWSLFITGPKIRVWGFHCPNGWRRWQDFVDPNDPGRRGPGCD